MWHTVDKAFFGYKLCKATKIKRYMDESRGFSCAKQGHKRHVSPDEKLNEDQ